jgi:hypothetical protein
MASKKSEGNPTEAMVIRKVTPEITTLSVPFARFGVFKFGGRGTIGMYVASEYHCGPLSIC